MNLSPRILSAVALATVLVLALGVNAIRNSHAANPPGANARALPVKAAVAEQGDVDERLKVVGRAEATQTVSVRPRVSAQVASLEFTPGQKVKKGQLLLRLDPALLDAQLAQAEGVVKRDQAQLAKAQADLKRYQEISQQGYVAKIDLDSFKSALGIAEANLAADQAAAQVARTQRSFADITAPFDGVVGAALVYPGATVTANTTDLVVLNQVDPVRVAFALPEARLVDLRREIENRTLAVAAEVGDDGNQRVEGHLEFVDNAVDASTGTIVLKARYDNRDGRITPGQFITVSVPIRRLLAAVTVPVVALQNSPTGPFVYVIGADGTVSQRPVTPGAVIADRLVLEHGVVAGEKIVTEGQLALTPGAKVKVLDEGTAMSGEGAPLKAIAP